jgi:hypothetical protein
MGILLSNNSEINTSDIPEAIVEYLIPLIKNALAIIGTIIKLIINTFTGLSPISFRDRRHQPS